MIPPGDPFDTDKRPPHWVDEDGNFTAWMSEAEISVMAAESDTEVSLADLLAATEASDDELIAFGAGSPSPSQRP